MSSTNIPSIRVPRNAHPFENTTPTTPTSPARPARPKVSSASIASPRIPSAPAAPTSMPLFVCVDQACMNDGIGFSRKADLERHIAAIHKRETFQLIDCQYRDCHRRGDKGFTRKDKMIEHMRDLHKADIPKKRFELYGK